jgi:hypothetical protein
MDGHCNMLGMALRVRRCRHFMVSYMGAHPANDTVACALIRIACVAYIDTAANLF